MRWMMQGLTALIFLAGATTAMSELGMETHPTAAVFLDVSELVDGVIR